MVKKVQKSKASKKPESSTKVKANKEKITNGHNAAEAQQNVETEEPVVSININSTDVNTGDSSRKRKPAIVSEEKKTKAKKQKVELEIPKITAVPGKLFVIGENDVGQLGFTDDVSNKKRPALLDLPYSFVDIAAGGMHSVCLTEQGQVLTFGCNDEGALGRNTENDEGSEFIPRRVEIPERVVQVCAGDSHSAALSESGKVYVWGNFRDGTGPMGLVRNRLRETSPVQLPIDTAIVKIRSGSDHLVCLSQEGSVYTCGCAESGQLGRISPRSCANGGREGIMSLIRPGKVQFREKFVEDIYTGSYSTFLKTRTSGLIYGFGLNNYSQLGFEGDLNVYKPRQITSFNSKSWQQINGGQHHTLALDDAGLVHAFGRADYGRLGLGENAGERSEPTEIPVLQDNNCIDISSGNCVSFAVANDGYVYSWGFGTNHQLGHGNDEDQHIPHRIEGNFLNSWQAFKISGGGQHTLILARPRTKNEA